MPTPAKAAKIEELAEKLARSRIAILIQTQGLSVKEMNELRSKVRPLNVEVQVAKNTLLRLAVERNQLQAVDPSIFQGQTTVAFGYDDEVAAAKAITDYLQTSNLVVLKAAILGGSHLTPERVEALARITGGKPSAQAQLVGGLQGPLSTTYSLLTAPLRDLCYVLQARAEQLQQQQQEPSA
ncbi:50S ribosomal protein L10 [Thermogemmatispora sp.]|uniref:50S ribosomal protein L10 n=1 Tax=Thermogemmatispora sp. TaxID=1968838 RepID=UPI0035E45029